MSDEWGLDDPDLPDVSRLVNKANRRALNGRKAKRRQAQSPPEDKAAFAFSYRASRHERQWIVDSLGNFHQHQWFDDVLRLVKGGKEASVYLVSGNATTNTEFIAAKIYRPRMFRQLRKDHLYRLGRDRLDDSGNVVIDEGTAHAMAKRSAFGLQALHTSWIMHEVRTLKLLNEAGAAVPVVFASGDNAILMTYVGDAEQVAPTLDSVVLSPDEAAPLFAFVVDQIDLMLSVDRVHGDLSAYNMLYWDGELTLIDFPQAVGPNKNPSAWMIFKRDVTRVCEYFARMGVKDAGHPGRLARDLWTSYGHRVTKEKDVRALREDDDAMAFWDDYRSARDGD